MRIDGRPADRLRPLTITPDHMPTAEGSALIEAGNTKVICTASVEDGVPAFLRGSGQGWVTAEYAMLPRATVTRTPREVSRGRPSGRTAEIQRLIGRSLRAAIDRGALGERTIHVDCDVIQADGGTRAAAITGGWVALAAAVKQLHEYKAIEKMPLRGYLGAVSAGIVEGRPMLDLCYEEDSRADVDMNAAMTSHGEFVEIQASAEGRAFSRGQLLEMLSLAQSGIEEIISKQKLAVEI